MGGGVVTVVGAGVVAVDVIVGPFVVVEHGSNWIEKHNCATTPGGTSVGTKHVAC